MKKLKIALLSYRSAPFGGGQGIYVRDLSDNLTKIGHIVDVISGPPYPDLKDSIKLIKLPGLNLFETFELKDRIRKLKKKNNKSFLDYYEFFSALTGQFPELYSFGERAKNYLIKNNEYDIVIDNQSISYGFLEIQKKFPSIQIIHHPITKDLKNDLVSSNKSFYKLSRYLWYSFLLMQKKVAKKTNKIITVSQSSKNDIIKDFRCRSENIEVIYNGLDTSIFAPKNYIERKRFNLITTASADAPIKGLDYTLLAIKELKKEFKEISLTVIGKAKKNGHTRKLIKKLDIEENVIFKTDLSKDDIASEYAKSSIAIVSSLYEGFGYPIIEAMSCAVPLVATNVSSIPELVNDFAFLIEPKSSNQIIQAVEKIINDYDFYKNRALHGRSYIKKAFNWNDISKQYCKIFYDTIEEFSDANF